MTQIATVERILDAQRAEISVPRKSACGHDCEECAGCGMTGAAIHAKAKNPRLIVAVCGCMVQRPEMAKAIETLTPEGVSSNKQLVVKLVKGKHFFTLTQMYRLKNGI